ncbi:MAG: rRNA maturation RNase YbeY [Rickettsiales bacterium]|jgi:rRNA maturation RNase YbeY|nr:rRNA maturation RNase YbeY [Rickettsiales bacterium]
MLIFQVAREDPRWSGSIGISRVKLMTRNLFSLVRELLGYRVERGVTVEISIVLTNDEEISLLNKNYRGVEGPTNVLSFPLYEREFPLCLGHEKYVALGDIVLSIDSIERESAEQNKFLREHLSHLIVHGLLHLLGFDHIAKEEAEIMERAEMVLLHRFEKLFLESYSQR